MIAACLSVWLLASCGPTEVQCRPDPNPMIGTRCLETGNPTDAAGTTATAATLWGVAGGCTLRGCEPPYHCNAKTELCEGAR